MIVVTPQKIRVTGLISQKLAPFLWLNPKLVIEPTPNQQKSSYATIEPEKISKKNPDRLQ